jgi:serine/threonine-protein phosphatase 6 regulatory ankyrin repeat subunit B
MVAILGVLCGIVCAECRIDSDGQNFLQKALHSEKSVVPGLFDSRGFTPLGVASYFGCPLYLKDLLKADLDINALDKNNWTALCIGSGHGDLEVVTELIGLGAGTEISCGSDGLTALMYAARAGNPEVVEQLLQAGARANAQGWESTTAVCCAAVGNHGKVIELLFEAGADLDLSGTTWPAPLFAAALQGAIEAAKVLVGRGAKLEARFGGRTALLTAAAMNDMGMVKMLVEELADVDAIDAEGWSTLHQAAQNGNVEMLRLLKAAGSWLHTANKKGFTALHCAVLGGARQLSRRF